jgi:hypothetical protein
MDEAPILGGHTKAALPPLIAEAAE